ncbi:MFS general substrate transporter [Lichtheimia hyalospora FSU 10163]|nr:MFS general substrate transporter [Lichtheimia hyalospora FSU 10163]
MFSWGAFQQYYLEQVYNGQTDSFHIAFVGTIAYMFSTSLGIPMGYVIYYIGYRRTMMLGTVLVPLSLFLASICNQLWQTALTHGAMLGIGASFCVSATFVLPSQWFIKHRALANGIGNMGVPFGGICFSPLTQYLLDTLGYRNALRTMGCILFVVFSLATILIRARYPPKPPQYRGGADEQDEKANTSSPLLSPRFILFLVFMTLAPFGYLIPFYLMPTYATKALGASNSLGAAMVSIASASNCISRIFWGYTADRYGEMNTLIFTTGISGTVSHIK